MRDEHATPHADHAAPHGTRVRCRNERNIVKGAVKRKLEPSSENESNKYKRTYQIFQTTNA